jgi:hypothetical protein
MCKSMDNDIDPIEVIVHSRVEYMIDFEVWYTRDGSPSPKYYLLIKKQGIGP